MRAATFAVLGLVALAFAVAPCGALVVGCGGELWPDPKPVTPPEGACEAAERRLVELQCPEAKASGGFAAFCRRYAARAVDLHPQCIARVTTCADVDAASRGDRC